MSLWDVDKTGGGRESSVLNQRDQVLQRRANSTTAIHPVTDATTTTGFLKSSNGQILGNNGTNNVGLFGFDSAGNMVVKVAKPGYDADTAANSNLIFNSAQNVFKIVGSGTVSLLGTYSHGVGAQSNVLIDTKSVAHNLGYYPATLIYSLPTSAAGYKPVSDGSIIVNGFSSTYNYSFTREFFVTTTTIVFNIFYNAYLSSGTTSGTLGEDYKYYLLQETAN